MKNERERQLITGRVRNLKSAKKARNRFIIVFPAVPAGIMRDLRSNLEKVKAQIRRNSNGGIDITPEDPCCQESVADLAFHIGELEFGITVDASTIPPITSLV